MKIESFTKDGWSFGIDADKVADQLELLAVEIRAARIVPKSASLATIFSSDEFAAARFTLDFSEKETA